MMTLSVSLVPAFGAGLLLLAANAIKCQRRALLVTHNHFWLRSAWPWGRDVSGKRSDIIRVQIRQSWLQSKLGSGDLVIHVRGLERPLLVCGMADVRNLRRRLARHLLRPQRRLLLPAPAPVTLENARPELPPLPAQQLAA